MRPQIIRIVLLTIGIVTSYATARYFLTPPSFGQYGFYRGAAIEEIAAQPPLYAGMQSCEKNCHAKALDMIAKGEHKTVSCEACHGNCREHDGLVRGVSWQLPRACGGSAGEGSNPCEVHALP